MTRLSDKSPSGIGHLIAPIKLKGPEQMALDEILLDNAIKKKGSKITLRFYDWEGVWISIGRNQKVIPTRWKKIILEKNINLVRRPSGGEAVLHGSGITYALIWKDPPRKKKEAYFQANQWLIQSFSKLGLDLEFGKEKASLFSGNCFSSSTSADLIDKEGNKLVGSAQRWKNGHLLQHGEILINPPKDLWQDFFKTPPIHPLDNYLPQKYLEDLFFQGIKSFWPKIKWEKLSISKRELDHAKLNSRNYFSRLEDLED